MRNEKGNEMNKMMIKLGLLLDRLRAQEGDVQEIAALDNAIAILEQCDSLRNLCDVAEKDVEYAERDD